MDPKTLLNPERGGVMLKNRTTRKRRLRLTHAGKAGTATPSGTRERNEGDHSIARDRREMGRSPGPFLWSVQSGRGSWARNQKNRTGGGTYLRIAVLYKKRQRRHLEKPSEKEGSGGKRGKNFNRLRGKTPRSGLKSRRWVTHIEAQRRLPDHGWGGGGGWGPRSEK